MVVAELLLRTQECDCVNDRRGATGPTSKQAQQAHWSQKAAPRISHDTVILSEAPLLPGTDARPLDFKREVIRGQHFVAYFCFEGVFLANQGGAHGPNTLAIRAGERFVHRELTERVINVIVIPHGPA